MAFGTYKTFGQIKDEDKYLRFFTKRNIAYAFTGLFLSAPILKIADTTHHLIAGAVISLVIFTIFTGTSFIRIPVDKYLNGGGLFLTSVIQRYLMRRMKSNRVLYTKYHREEGSIWLS